jgi:hypothetical protein
MWIVVEQLPQLAHSIAPVSTMPGVRDLLQKGFNLRVIIPLICIVWGFVRSSVATSHQGPTARVYAAAYWVRQGERPPRP